MGDTRKHRSTRRTKAVSTRVHTPPSLRGVAENLYSLQQDLEIARKIQGRLFPASPAIPGWEFSAFCQPAGEVGGDFYDFMPGDDGKIGILVADASGKGLAGALLMVEARAMIRAMASMSTSPKEILTLVNRVLLHDLEKGMFVTVFFAVLDTEKRTLTMANAGHTPMLLWRARTGEVETIQPRGLVVGAAGEDAFGRAIVEESVALDPGDRFLLYTDGVSELMNPVRDEFGMERLSEWMAANAHLTADAAMLSLMGTLEQHRAGQTQSDDITILTGRLLT